MAQEFSFDQGVGGQALLSSRAGAMSSRGRAKRLWTTRRNRRKGADAPSIADDGGRP